MISDVPKFAFLTSAARRMWYGLMTGLVAFTVVGVIRGVEAADEKLEGSDDSTKPPPDRIVFPSITNALQFRLYTNASSTASHLFNTFDIVALGQNWLSSPGGEPLKRWLADSPPGTSLHNILVNGKGPVLAPTNGMSVIEQVSGPDWCYTALDVTAAYRGRLQEYRRGVLFIQPDLFVLHDHLIAGERAKFQMVLHPPAATKVDPVWGDLRLDSTNGGFRIHTPSWRHESRVWSLADSSGGVKLPGTVAVQIGPSNTLATLDLVTVFAAYPAGAKTDYAFKLLESKTAVGARIHRDGLPTLVAFKTDLAATNPTLTGFPFKGPVGVDIFKPKQKGAKTVK